MEARLKKETDELAKQLADIAATKQPAAASLPAPVHSEPQSIVPGPDRGTTRMTHEHSV